MRLGGLGPSADTTAKRKRWVVSLLTPQQSEGYLVKAQSIASMNNQNNFIGTISALLQTIECSKHSLCNVLLEKRFWRKEC